MGETVLLPVVTKGWDVHDLRTLWAFPFPLEPNADTHETMTMPAQIPGTT